MLNRILLSLAIALLVASGAIASAADSVASKSSAGPIEVGPADWPWWRGPSRDGVAAADQKPPLKWSETENVLWKADIPGRGHGSPTVVGNQVFLATADPDREVQAVLCFDRHTGNRLWETGVHHGAFEKKGNKKTSLASVTPACDGRLVFVNFLHAGAIYATALTRDGEQIWQKKITDYAVHQGYGASPAIYASLVLVSADNQGSGVIAALDRATGDEVWKLPRPKLHNYTSPVIFNIAGRDQLLFTGCNLVTSLDPLKGNKLWEVAGSTTECVTSTVSDGRHIFTSGGYPKNHLAAVRADGSGSIAWENGSRVYVPSLLVRDGYLYGVLDAGAAACWKCDTGREMWKSRLGGTFSSSPVLVGERIYVTNEEGKTFIFKASPDAFELDGENQLGEDVYATPTICGSRIYARVAKVKNDKRQEVLFCLGSQPQ